MIKLDLNGKWQFKNVVDDSFLEAKVPSCNYVDLMENNKIADPFYGTQERDAYWVSEADWVYKRSFIVDEKIISNKRVVLVCESIDTIATIKINGSVVKECNNQHMTYEIDIKGALAVGENEIEIIFYSPVKYVKDRQSKEKCPRNNNGIDGVAHIRKTQCHFGWDWGPVLTPSGISRDIYILAFDSRLDEFKHKQRHNLDGSVDLSIHCEVENRQPNTMVQVSIVSPNGNVVEQYMDRELNDIEFSIDNPILWWTAEFSDNISQPLYTIKISLLKDSTVIDVLEKKVGLRSIQLDRSKDKYGENFAFVLNGKRIFAKGANWIPSDSFVTRTSKEQIEKYISIAKQSNFNMIRVWGGGYYESDYFYDLCDKYGILVWQDFTFACQAYPFFVEEFLQNAKQDIICNIKRLRHHASLALWCGNNEIELMSPAWMARRDYIEWTEKFFYSILPPIVAENDDITPFISGTPTGNGHNKNVTSANIGNTHLWAVWHGLQDFKYYRTVLTRFCSEFGFESLPDIRTIESFAEEKDYDLDSEVFNSHQKCTSGNRKIMYYITTRFRLPLNFKDYIYLSNICQSECIKDATEHWRRNIGRCNGSLYWQFNDCWPTCSWSSIDYYGRYKALQYTSKHFFSKLMISIEDGKKQAKVCIHNDTLIDQTVRYELNLASFCGQSIVKVGGEIVVPANSAKYVNAISLNSYSKEIKTNSFLSAKLFKGDELINAKTLLLAKEKYINFIDYPVDVKVDIVDNTAFYAIQSSGFIRYLCVSSACDTAFSDNYIDILPNETTIISQPLDGSYSEQELLDSLTFKSLANVISKASIKSDKWEQIKFFVKPMNFINWIYYKFL